MRRLQLAIALCLTFATFAVAAEQELTKDQIKEFLLKAKVVRSRQTSKGITQPYRLTLTDGTVTHEAVFQAIDQHKTTMQFADGHVEINFVDSYKYNLAAYVLAEMLGMDDLIPIHVERKWNGNVGSLSWLVPVQMDEEDRMKRKVNAPDVDAWNKQMYKVRVFDELVFDTDANLTNVLVGDGWKLWRVDFSRAFRLNKDVKSTANLTHCERKLFESLKALNAKEFRERMKPYLTGAEMDGVLARRDKIVSFIQKSIAEKGENEILY
jgi:hypothetical protein